MDGALIAFIVAFVVFTLGAMSMNQSKARKLQEEQNELLRKQNALLDESKGTSAQ